MLFLMSRLVVLIPIKKDCLERAEQSLLSYLLNCFSQVPYSSHMLPVTAAYLKKKPKEKHDQIPVLLQLEPSGRWDRRPLLVESSRT